jgi:hypothetical protein
MCSTLFRYAWFIPQIVVADIGTVSFEHCKPIADFVQRLKFEREDETEKWTHWHGLEVRESTSLEEVKIVTYNVDAGAGQCRPCGKENVFIIDASNDHKTVSLEELDSTG